MNHRLLTLLFTTALAAQMPATAPQQGEPRLTGSTVLSLESLYHPTKKLPFLERPKTHFDWMPDGALLATKTEEGKLSATRIDLKKNSSSAHVEPDQVVAELVKLGVDQDLAKRAVNRGNFTWDKDFRQFIVAVDADLYAIELGKDGPRAQRLTSSKEPKDDPTFSPDGKKVAYLRGNDLYAVDLATGKETQLTRGGSATLFNGRLDWVYQEEIYGRGTFRAFWWSPDSQRIAYLSLDESKVPVYTLVDDRSQPQKVLTARYPKAGDPNPIARLGVVDLVGQTTWMEDPYPGKETLLVQVGWDPKGLLLASYQDRLQTWLELRRFEGTASSVMVKESGKAWQERLPLPVFLKDGGFIWESDRTGHRHLYRYDKKGKPMRAVTAGTWEVRDFYGVDEKSKRVYFSATENNPAGLDSYSADLDGALPNGLLARHTLRGGTHRMKISPDFQLGVDSWSDAHSPTQVGLVDMDGRVVKALEGRVTQAFKDIRFGRVAFQTVLTKDGFPMPTMLVLPPDFDAKKKYPIFQHIYGGPQAPQVLDAFSASMLWYHFLAQQGYVVWVCDNRSASGKGLSSAEGIYKRLGEQELKDQLEGLEWLGRRPWADMGRVALEGWSYGGFMTAYALTHCSNYKLGLVGAPVTDWRLYDSIYTERFMGLPSENAAGYDATSVLKAANNLHGKALIFHGTLDDNVHPQNTIQFLDALQKAGHTADAVLLPGSAHGPSAPQHVYARMQAMWEFIQKNL
ncbi:MAG: S9 family peptidase [Holophagaceae bacterium]|nr:S9 family peptidase [Holophagaceae bacterium]